MIVESQRLNVVRVLVITERRAGRVVMSVMIAAAIHVVHAEKMVADIPAARGVMTVVAIREIRAEMTVADIPAARGGTTVVVIRVTEGERIVAGIPAARGVTIAESIHVIEGERIVAGIRVAQGVTIAEVIRVAGVVMIEVAHPNADESTLMVPSSTDTPATNSASTPTVR
jgi:hypothetical protein